MSEPRDIDLRAYGYAPGHYLCKCMHCGQHHEADKRAASCETCAMRRALVDFRARAEKAESALATAEAAGIKRAANLLARRTAERYMPRTVGDVHAQEDVAAICKIIPSVQSRSSVKSEVEGLRATDEIAREYHSYVWNREIYSPEISDEELRDDGRPAGLHVDIIKGRLVISIGISALCFAATRGPYFDDICARTSQDIIVTDQDAFAKEILRELRREEEDGTTLVHLMLDKAAERAVENGAEGIEIPEVRS